jgi:hypothetical protein
VLCQAAILAKARVFYPEGIATMNSWGIKRYSQVQWFLQVKPGNVKAQKKGMCAEPCTIESTSV